MTASTPLLLAGLKRDPIGLVDAICPVSPGTYNRVIHPIKGTASTVTRVAHFCATKVFLISKLDIVEWILVMTGFAIQRKRAFAILDSMHRMALQGLMAWSTLLTIRMAFKTRRIGQATGQIFSVTPITLLRDNVCYCAPMIKNGSLQTMMARHARYA
jgi:hypothetical protein